MAFAVNDNVKVRNLASTLQDPYLKSEATEALRGLISEIRMVPDAHARNSHHIELAGDLAGILALEDAQTTRPAASAGLRSETLVAGGRIDLDRTVVNLSEENTEPSFLQKDH